MGEFFHGWRRKTGWKTLAPPIVCAIACAAIGLGLTYFLPILLLRNVGIRPEWYGNIAGLCMVPFIIASLCFSGLMGLIAGVMRPIKQAILLTLLSVIVADICCLAVFVDWNMGKTVHLYFVSAVIKIPLMVLVFVLVPNPSQLPSAEPPPEKLLD